MDSCPSHFHESGFFFDFEAVRTTQAMVARQLFDACWDAGLVLVATSNRPPEALYEGGPNRQYFSPFVTRRARGVRRCPYAIDARRLDTMLRAGCASSVELFVSTGRATIGGCG